MWPLRFPLMWLCCLSMLLAPASVLQAESAPLPTPEQLAEANPGKLIYLDFWASWCVPCRRTFPFMNDLQRDYADTLKVVAVNVDTDAKQAAAFLDAFPANFEILYDPDGVLPERMALKGMPSSYLIGPDGAVVGEHVGFRNGDESRLREQIERAIEALLP